MQPSRGWTALNLCELWQYRELIFFLAWRDVKVRYKQTIIGVVWVLLQPLAMVSVFWLLFGRIAQLPSDGIPYPLYVLVGLIPWQFFSRVIGESTNSLITDQRLITRVYFPRLVVPIATTLTALVDFGLAMCLVIVLMIWFGAVPGAALLFLPIAILLMLLAAMGVGFWLSALNVEYRDVMHAVPFLVQFWFFVTPILYGTSILPDSWRWLFALNPVTSVVESFHWCLLGTIPMDATILIMSAALAIASFFFGMMWFRRRERSFVDSLGGGA
ncbi:MAG: phosphate ABC transporter permease [Chloroflexi bacterium]|nr:MAG: phosphate ABC transporter permease [Chloroflexota bacterium]